MERTQDSIIHLCGASPHYAISCDPPLPNSLEYLGARKGEELGQFGWE